MASTPLLTPDEAAARLLISPRTLRTLKSTGAIRYVALSARRIAYREDDLREYVDSRVRQDDACTTLPAPKRASRRGVIVPFSQRSRP